MPSGVAINVRVWYSDIHRTVRWLFMCLVDGLCISVPSRCQNRHIYCFLDILWWFYKLGADIIEALVIRLSPTTYDEIMFLTPSNYFRTLPRPAFLAASRAVHLTISTPRSLQLSTPLPLFCFKSSSSLSLFPDDDRTWKNGAGSCQDPNQEPTAPQCALRVLWNLLVVVHRNRNRDAIHPLQREIEHLDQRKPLSLCHMFYVLTFQINLGWGLAIAFTVYTCSKTSGGHFNPAVSIAFLTLGKLPLKDFLVYCVVQTLGAALGSAAAFGLYYGIH